MRERPCGRLEDCQGCAFCAAVGRDERLRAKLDVSPDWAPPEPKPAPAHKPTPARVDPPPLATQAVSALTAVARWVGSGLQVVSAEVRASRQAICLACPIYDNGQCRKCGCNLALKQRMASEECPEGKW